MRRPMREKSPLKAPRGQAMVEYTMVTHVLLLGGTFLLWVFTTTLMNAISAFYESVYWILTSSVP